MAKFVKIFVSTFFSIIFGFALLLTILNYPILILSIVAILCAAGIYVFARLTRYAHGALRDKWKVLLSAWRAEYHLNRINQIMQIESQCDKVKSLMKRLC